MRPDGTGMRPLLPEFRGEKREVSWSADGERLYFISQGELFVRESRHWLGWMRTPRPERLAGGSVRHHRAQEDPADPRVVYSMGEVFRGESRKLNIRTGHFEPFLDGLSADCVDFSPDGQWIAYVSFPARELWKCRRDGSDRVLLEDRLLTYMPRWSPDSKRLAFAAVEKGIFAARHRIYTVAADGGRTESVKGVDGPAFDPNWSPDGESLVFAPLEFSATQAKDQHVSIVDLKTGVVRMVSGSEDMFSPRWSPDGNYLVAIRYKQTQPAIHDFASERWADVDATLFGFPMWSKDSKSVYGLLQSQSRLVRIAVATRRIEEIRSVKEFRLTGTLDSGASWTPDGEPVILVDLTSSEIYRIEVER